MSNRISASIVIVALTTLISLGVLLNSNRVNRTGAESLLSTRPTARLPAPVVVRAEGVSTEDSKATKVFMSTALEDSFLPSPYQLVEHADIIVIGKAATLVKQGATPWDQPIDENQGATKTVRSFEIEQVLKGGSQPTNMKVSEPGAVLNGQGSFRENHPRLVAGRRYILFLTAPTEQDKSLGFRAVTIGGKTYNNGDLDEFYAARGAESKLLLENGTVVEAYDEYQQGHLPKFADKLAKPIIGRPEAEVVTELKKCVADGGFSAWRRRHQEAP